MTQITHPPEPRIELEPAFAPRLEPETLPLAVLPPTPPGGVGLALGGIGVLGLGAAGLGVEHLIAGAFAVSALLGWSTATLAAIGFGMIGVGMWRELRGLWGLRHVDHLRAALAASHLPTVREAAIDWIADMPGTAAILPALREADSPETLRALLRAGPAATLRARTDALSTTASLQILAAIAAIPSPMLDGLLVAWRGIRLVRQVAELHGLRPGLFATLALLRRTLLSAALVTATDIAANTAAHALFSNKLLGHIAGDTAAALVAARRMRLLARAAAMACSPLEG